MAALSLSGALFQAFGLVSIGLIHRCRGIEPDRPVGLDPKTGEILCTLVERGAPYL
jgi:hypothetical protein